MKLLIINTVRFRLNGITSVILNYYRNMDKSDMEIDFVVTNEISQEYWLELEANGCNIFQLQRKSNPLQYMLQLYRIMKRNRYDIVHVHGNSAMMTFDILPAVLAGVPVRIAHSHNTTCSHMKLHKLLLPVFRRCYTHGFACGQAAGEWLFGNDHYEVIENGIELKKYAFDPTVRAQFREKLDAGNKTVLGHIGNFVEQKNHTFLIDVFAELLKRDPNHLLVLISDGALMDTIREKVQGLGISDSVVFVGKTTQVSEYFQAMDLFLLPSLYEGLPVVLIEAQAAGIPCVVSDKVSKESDLSDSLVFLPIDDVNAWVEEVQRFRYSNREANSTAWRRTIASKGYDVTQNAQRMKSLYVSYVVKS